MKASQRFEKGTPAAWETHAGVRRSGGSRTAASLTAAGQACWTSLGLLEFARQTEQAERIREEAE